MTPLQYDRHKGPEEIPAHSLPAQTGEAGTLWVPPGKLGDNKRILSSHSLPRQNSGGDLYAPHTSFDGIQRKATMPSIKEGVRLRMDEPTPPPPGENVKVRVKIFYAEHYVTNPYYLLMEANTWVSDEFKLKPEDPTYYIFPGHEFQANQGDHYAAGTFADPRISGLTMPPLYFDWGTGYSEFSSFDNNWWYPPNGLYRRGFAPRTEPEQRYYLPWTMTFYGYFYADYPGDFVAHQTFSMFFRKRDEQGQDDADHFMKFYINYGVSMVGSTWLTGLIGATDRGFFSNTLWWYGDQSTRFYFRVECSLVP